MRLTTILAGAILAVGLVGSSLRAQTTPPAASRAATTKSTAESTTLVVSAAASTVDVMEELIKKFASHGGAEVKLNSGPSNGLATQIIGGAPAHLFLSASKQWADEVKKADRAVASCELLTNNLVLVVPKGNPANVHRPEDLATDRVMKIALAGENVPAGQYAAQALRELGLWERLDRGGKIVRGQDVRAALSFVERGEAEGGVVYATDVRAASGVEEVYAFDPQLHDKIVYSLVLLKSEEGADEAKAFYQFLQSKEALDVFATHGFQAIDTAQEK